MPAVYSASAKWRRIYVLWALAWIVLAFFTRWPNLPLCLVGFLFCCHRAVLHGQCIVLTRAALICQSATGVRQLPYRQVGRLRYATWTGDVLIERPWLRVRIPHRFHRGDELRRAISLAVWAHRGGAVPPDLTDSDSAFS